MRYVVQFHPEAESELNDAADFLDRESPGLGVAFLDAVQRTVDQIQRLPEAAPLVSRRVRRKLVIKFPYSIFYSIRHSHIRILAVGHQKRRPYYWKSRR